MKSQARTRKLPGYQHRLFAAASGLAIMRGVSHAVFEHDGWCAIFQRQPCNCTPNNSIAHDGSVQLIDAMGAVSRTSKQ